ncbi:MAG: leucine-rich repeat domain-containing protein [Paludibacteraceae bacterium]|nr:leucine-rich repeat domain-containing protein [Paludibacteraceae bacterium]
MKYSKFLSLIFVAVATLGNLYAKPIRVGMLNYELDSNQSIAKVVSCEITGDITIPELIVVNDIKYKIISIGERAFYKDSNLVSITFPNSLISIDKEAFFGCSSLKRIVLPQKILTIGNHAFAECSQIREVCNLNLTPIPLNKTVFEKINLSHCVLIVHPSAIDSYKSVKGWKDFTNIIPLQIRYN